MMAHTHKPLHFAVVICTLVVMCVMFFINADGPSRFIPGLFYYDMAELSDKYYVEITPAGATFSIWGAIYFWQVAFIAYGLSTLCRHGPEGFLYYSPGIMPVDIYIWYMLNNCLNISWLILFDRELMHVSLAVAALMWITLFIPLVISHKVIHDKLQDLRKFQMMKEAWMIRFMVQNGLAFYCTWVTIATLLNLSIVLTYFAGMDQSVASTISLGILSGEIVLWIVLDFFVLHRYTNYTFSPYLVLPIAIGGSLAKNINPWHHNTVITVTLLAVALLALVLKVILMIARHCRNRKMEVIDNTLEKKTVPA